MIYHKPTAIKDHTSHHRSGAMRCFGVQFCLLFLAENGWAKVGYVFLSNKLVKFEVGICNVRHCVVVSEQQL